MLFSSIVHVIYQFQRAILSMNATTIGAVQVVPLEGRVATTTPSPVHLFTSTLSRYRPELELLWVLLTYAPFMVQTYSYVSPRKTRVRQYPYPGILIHIFMAPLYVLRWHARYAALRVWPQPELFDLILFAGFWLGSVSLELSRVRKGAAVPLVRAGFQVTIALQGAGFAAAWVRGRDAALFRATVKFCNWFASYRSVTRLWAYLDANLAKNYAIASSLTMVASGCYAVWEAEVPYGVPLFLLSTAALVMAKRTLTERIAR